MIEVFDSRTDVADNVIVRPELRGRFLRLEPLPAAPMHSHDLAGEVFLTVEGALELSVEDESAILGPGQLAYVDKGLRHTLRAVGEAPCTVFLSLTPHVEPTHTFYDENGGRERPRYDAWRGARRADGSAERGLPQPDERFVTGELGEECLAALRTVRAASDAALTAMEVQMQALAGAAAVGSGDEARQAVDLTWRSLEPLFSRVGRLEEAWNALAPQAMCLGDATDRSTSGQQGRVR